jgi:hypothetical protein
MEAEWYALAGLPLLKRHAASDGRSALREIPDSRAGNG